MAWPLGTEKGITVVAGQSRIADSARRNRLDLAGVTHAHSGLLPTAGAHSGELAGTPPDAAKVGFLAFWTFWAKRTL